MGRPSRSPHAREPPCASHCLGARDRALCLITGIGVHTGTEALGLPEPLGAWGGGFQEKGHRSEIGTSAY